MRWSLAMAMTHDRLSPKDKADMYVGSALS